MDIFALRRQGFSFRTIAKKLGIHRNTVKKYLTQEKPPQYTRTSKMEPVLSSYLPLIDEWLSQDNYQASWIYTRIQQLGYNGGYRYEKNSTIITSNKSFGDWQELFGDPVIATAILYRLLHHCRVINIKGHSYRSRKHQIGKTNAAK